MTPDELLQQLEPLTHNARMRQMVEIGRLTTHDTSVAATLNALEKGGFYERCLALQSCYGSCDGAHALRAFADPSRVVRSLAQCLLPLIGDDAQVQAALDAATFKQRRALIWRLLNHCRQSPIDAFLNSLAASGDERLSQLLLFGSPKVIACHCEVMLHKAGLHDWQRLARLHPNIAADLLQSQAEVATNFDARLVYQVNAILPLLSYSYPARALTLCNTLTQYTSLARLNLQQLAERRPAEVADLILRSNDKACVSFDRVAHKLDTARLIELFLTRRDTVSRLKLWFPRLTPKQRLLLYTACSNCWRDSDGCLAPWLVALLPSHLREQQGRHHLTLQALATRPTQRLPYAAFLPWDEVCTTLNRFIRNPDPDLRVVAVTALVLATRFHRSRIPDLLTIVRDRRNEQDPVRCAMLMGLADLPPGSWRAEHLDDLSQIISDALNAADLSYTTANAAERLIIALLPFHPAWSAQKLATLVQERGQVSFYNLGDRLSNTDVRRIAPVLLPVLQSWETSEREVHLIAVGQSLGRRLRVFDALVDILEHVIINTHNTQMAAAALGLLAQHHRDRIHLLIPIATLLTHTDPQVRLEVLRRCLQLPVADPEQILLQKLLEAMNSLLPDECEAAAHAVFATYNGPYAHIVGDAVKDLIANRRALQTTVQALQAALTWSRGQLLPTARAVLEALATDPLTASLRVELATYALPWNELTVLLTHTTAGEMHAETLFIAVQAIAHAGSRSDAADLVHLEEALVKSSDEQLRRLALAALVTQSQLQGWNDERLVRLSSYCADPAPLVAAAAQFTLPPL